MSWLIVLIEEQRVLTEKLNLAKLSLGTAQENEKYWREKLEDLEIDAEDLRIAINEEQEIQRTANEVIGDKNNAH